MNDLWRKEYLHKVLVSQGEVWTTQPNPLKEKKVVMVADDKEKHLNWKIGVVQKLIVGRDGRCRAAVVHVKSGLLMDREKEAAEGEVPPPRRTRSGREIVRPHHLRTNANASYKVENVESRKISDLRTFKICILSKFRQTRRNLRDNSVEVVAMRCNGLELET